MRVIGARGTETETETERWGDAGREGQCFEGTRRERDKDRDSDSGQRAREKLQQRRENTTVGRYAAFFCARCGAQEIADTAFTTAFTLELVINLYGNWFRRFFVSLWVLSRLAPFGRVKR